MLEFPGLGLEGTKVLYEMPSVKIHVESHSGHPSTSAPVHPFGLPGQNSMDWGFEKTHMYLPQLWRLEVPDQGDTRFGVW